jgi:peptidoglycan hydrolase-like protein with peptidoglycan-binding domain
MPDGSDPPEAPPRTLRIGAVGDDVRRLQTFLKIKIDGIFGPLTARSVADWQMAHHLKSDGIFGPVSFMTAKQEGL